MLYIPLPTKTTRRPPEPQILLPRVDALPSELKFLVQNYIWPENALKSETYALRASPPWILLKQF